jgi:hypothetical protein
MAEGAVAFAQVVAVFIEHLQPGIAPHGKGGLCGQIRQILIAAQNVAEASGVVAVTSGEVASLAPMTAPSSAERRSRQRWSLARTTSARIPGSGSLTSPVSPATPAPSPAPPTSSGGSALPRDARSPQAAANAAAATADSARSARTRRDVGRSRLGIIQAVPCTSARTPSSRRAISLAVV